MREGGCYWERTSSKPHANLDAHFLCGQQRLQSHLQFHIYHSLGKQQWARTPQAPAVSQDMMPSVFYGKIVWSCFLRQNGALPVSIVLRGVVEGGKKGKKSKSANGVGTDPSVLNRILLCYVWDLALGLNLSLPPHRAVLFFHQRSSLILSQLNWK